MALSSGKGMAWPNGMQVAGHSGHSRLIPLGIRLPDRPSGSQIVIEDTSLISPHLLYKFIFLSSQSDRALAESIPLNLLAAPTTVTLSRKFRENVSTKPQALEHQWGHKFAGITHKLNLGATYYNIPRLCPGFGQ
jgi:hypothetical protein